MGKEPLSMLYKINEVTKIVGLSAETLRYYERQGLITPYRDNETGYRYYTDLQVNQLVLCRYYRQMGMNSQEIVRFLRSTSLEERTYLLDIVQHSLEWKMQWQHLVGSAVLASIDRARLFPQQVGQVFFESIPPFVWLDSQDAGQSVGMMRTFPEAEEHLRVIRHWIDLQPVIEGAMRYQIDLERRNVMTALGFVCPLDIAETLGINQDPYTMRFTQEKCISTVISLRQNQVITFNHIECLLKTLSRKNLNPVEDAFGTAVMIGPVLERTERLQKISLFYK